MPDSDLFVQTIEAVYASGLDSAHLPDALDSTSRLLNAAGACFEIIDKPTQQYDLLCTVGAPATARVPYLAEFAARNPRIPFALRQQVGSVSWDHKILDEASMARDPFYAEFLPHFGLRYFAALLLEQSPEKLAAISVQRTRKQGHVDEREIALMGRLYPHYRGAHDMAVRLRAVDDRDGILENALDWLADGVALLRADGNIVYVNDMFRSLVRQSNGLRIADNQLEFSSLETQRRFETALGAVRRLGDPACDLHPTDFPVPRGDEMPAYIVSVRPLMRCDTRGTRSRAEVMVFVRDPLWQNAATSQMLQELFGLTKAEAHLAQALCAGTTTTAYALERRVSLNTVYSHLKHIREKTGCKSVPEIVRKLGELNVPLRSR